MNAQVSHQAKWKKSVTQVYDEASIPFDGRRSSRKNATKWASPIFHPPMTLTPSTCSTPLCPPTR
jgi:hypothetical protein